MNRQLDIAFFGCVINDCIQNGILPVIKWLMMGLLSCSSDIKLFNSNTIQINQRNHQITLSSSPSHSNNHSTKSHLKRHKRPLDYIRHHWHATTREWSNNYSVMRAGDPSPTCCATGNSYSKQFPQPLSSNPQAYLAWFV